MAKFRQCLTELSAGDMIMAGYYSLTYLSHWRYFVKSFIEMFLE